MPRGTPAPTLHRLCLMVRTELKAISRDGDWLYEIRCDGYPVLASIGSPARLEGRGEIDATATLRSAFREVQRAARLFFANSAIAY